MLYKDLMELVTDKIVFEGFSTFVNPYSYMMLRKENNVLVAFDHVYVDGSSAALIFSILFRKKIIRRSFDFTSLATDFFEYAQENKSRIAIVGSTSEANEKFVSLISDRYPDVTVAYARNGYFDTDERELIFKEIDDSKPDFLIVGMGTPIQENFLADYRKSGICKSGFSCGGFIHQTASTSNGVYYPRIFDKMNIRWVYRIIDEPKLFSRYFIKYPIALLSILSDYFRYTIFSVKK